MTSERRRYRPGPQPESGPPKPINSAPVSRMYPVPPADGVLDRFMLPAEGRIKNIIIHIEKAVLKQAQLQIGVQGVPEARLYVVKIGAQEQIPYSNELATGSQIVFKLLDVATLKPENIWFSYIYEQ